MQEHASNELERVITVVVRAVSRVVAVGREFVDLVAGPGRVDEVPGRIVPRQTLEARRPRLTGARMR